MASVTMRSLRCVADAHAAFAAISERSAGRETDLRVEQQAVAEIERIRKARDFWKEIERAVGFRDRDAGHLREQLKAHVTIFLQPLQHGAQFVIAVEQRRLGRPLRNGVRIDDDELVELSHLVRQVDARHNPTDAPACHAIGL